MGFRTRVRFPSPPPKFGKYRQVLSKFFVVVLPVRNRVKAPRKLHIHQFLSALDHMDAIISPRARAWQSFTPAKCERQEITLPLGLRFPSPTASRTSYHSRRHFYVLSNAPLIHSVVLPFSKARALQGPFTSASTRIFPVFIFTDRFSNSPF